MSTDLPWDHLRVEVRRMRSTVGLRRLVPLRLHVGDLAGARIVVPLTAPLTAPALGPGSGDDVPLAADVVTRALERLGPGDQQVWLTRGGDLVARDADWRWRDAAALARARRGLEAGCLFVVTRHGWLELPGGRTRTWTRMRAGWQPPYEDDRPESEEPDPVEGWPLRF